MKNLAVRLVFIVAAVGVDASVVNRFIPDRYWYDTACLSMPHLLVSVRGGAGFATHSASTAAEATQAYRYDGLLEMTGSYDLQMLVAAAEESNPGYKNAFLQEVGGVAWDVTPQLIFGARSSASLYEAVCDVAVRAHKNVVVGVSVPVIKAEARQRYDFPVQGSTALYSQSDLEQVQRLRQTTHRDLGLKQGDWSDSCLGDISGYAALVRSWERVWLLRTIELAGMCEVSAPTSATTSIEYPSAFPLGNNGSWSFGLGMRPRFEIKEGIWLSFPFSVTWLSSVTHQMRVPVFAEPAPFGGIVGDFKVSSGVTIALLPKITFEHLIQHLHFSLGYYWTRHAADTVEDMREDRSVESCLTRKTVPGRTARFLSSRVDWEGFSNAQKEKSEWRRGLVRLEVEYELADFFSKLKNPPVFSVSLDYCARTQRAAAMHRLSAALVWKF